MRVRQALWLSLTLVAALALAGCQQEPAHEVTTGETLLAVAFNDPSEWETGTYPVGAEEPESTLSVVDGRFRIDHRSPRSPSFTWSLGGDSYEDVVVEVESEQLSEEENNLYGVTCRMAPDANGDASGYAILISGDGYYGFARIASRSLTFLVDWHQSDVINQGQATNHIRAVCVDDYLALYVNGEFMGDVTDSTYTQPGQVGLIAGVTQNATIGIAFDDLTVYEGRISD